MTIVRHLTHQVRRSAAVLIAANVAALAVLVITVVQDRVPPPLLLRDPVNITRQPYYLGLLSNAGALLWCAAAVCCFFAASLTPVQRLRRFLVSSGLITALLGLDDFFVLHETVLPVHLGVHERLVVGLYAVAILAYLALFYRTLLQTDYLLLLVAGFFFAWSLSLDFRFMFRTPYDAILDDALKVIGLANWTAYYVRTSHQVVTRHGLAALAASRAQTDADALAVGEASGVSR